MENIISISGKTKFSITLDPGVWIFDDRRIDLNSYFENDNQQVDESEEYAKSISKYWDREIKEGAINPPTLQTERLFEKEKILTGTFGIPFKPFLRNAEPTTEANFLLIESEDGDIRIPLKEAEKLILGFSNNGKPLKEDGPVYVYFGDGSNKDNPIKKVKSFKVE